MQRLEGMHPAAPHPPASTLGHPLLDTCLDALSTSGQRARTKNRVGGLLSELIIHETRKVLALLLSLVRGSCLRSSQTLRPALRKTGKRVSPQVKWPDLGSAGPSSSIPLLSGSSESRTDGRTGDGQVTDGHRVQGPCEAPFTTKPKALISTLEGKMYILHGDGEEDSG